VYGVYYILHVLALVLKPRGRTQSGFSVAGCCVASAKMTWSSVGHTYQQKKTPLGSREELDCVCSGDVCCVMQVRKSGDGLGQTSSEGFIHIANTTYTRI